MKVLKRVFIVCFLLIVGENVTFSQESIKQTLNIYTHFKSVVDHPSWLLELRDVESGQVLPYLFDISNKDNFLLAFSKEDSYRVTASVLKFGPYATVKNFCNLEGGVISGKSMFIHLTGVLSPDPSKTICHVTKFAQTQFTIVTQETDTSEEENAPTIPLPLLSNALGVQPTANNQQSAPTGTTPPPSSTNTASSKPVVQNRGV